MASLLIQKRRRLLEHSEIVKQYPILIRILENEIEINDDNIHQFEKPIRDFCINTLPNVYEAALSEWKGEKYPREDLKEKRTTCRICGNPNNRWVFYIVNKLNGYEMNIGSDCIENFNISEHEGRTPRQMIELAKEIKRKETLNARYEGIEKTIKTWNDILNNYDIELPTDLENEYIKLGKEIKKYFSNYTSGKVPEDDMDIFEEYLKRQDDFIEKMDDYVTNHRNDKFILTKEMSNKLNNKDQLLAFKRAKKHGYVTKLLAYELTNNNFMTFMANEFNQLNTTNKIYIKTAIGSSYIFVYEPLNQIVLYCSHKVFIDMFGDCIFKQKKFSVNKDKLIPNTIIKEQNSLTQIIKLLKNKLWTNELNFHYTDVGANKLIVYERASDSYIDHNLKEFVNIFKGIVFGVWIKDLKDASKYLLEPNHKRFTRSQIREIIAISEGRTKQFYKDQSKAWGNK